MQNKEAIKVISKRKRLLYSEWLKHFYCWQASGQTKQAYCIAHNISFEAFKKQYSVRNKESKKIVEKSPCAFVPVQLSNEPITQVIELIFPSGVLIKIPSSLPLPSVIKSVKNYL